MGRQRRLKKAKHLQIAKPLNEETAQGEDIFDILGSYTGKPEDDEYPVQDADDL